MITIPELVAQALGTFLASDTRSRFGSSHGRQAETCQRLPLAGCSSHTSCRSSASCPMPPTHITASWVPTSIGTTA